MNFAQCGTRIYPYCKGIKDQGIFVAKLFRSGGSNQFSDSPYDSHEYEKKLISGQEPKPLADKLKRTFPSPINTDGIAKFLEEHINDDCIPEAMNAYGFPDIADPDKKALAGAIARQYQLIFESSDADVEDIVFAEYKRILDEKPAEDLRKFKPLYQGDGISVYGGEQGYQEQTDGSFRHTWELRNTGLVTWEQRKLVFIKTYKVGPLAEETEIEIPKAEPGSNKKIAVVMQTRGKEGRFDCHFEMHDAEGRDCFPNHKNVFDIKVEIDFVPKEATEA